MRRKKQVKREPSPDSKYGNVVITKFVNYLMYDGKKSVAQKVFYGALDTLEKQGKNPLEVFDLAIKNVSPQVEVRSRRIGGANYQVPREVRGDRKLYLAIRWLIDSARKKKGKPMAEKLAEEFVMAANNEGVAIKKKMDTHRMADANKAFAHFAW